MDIEEFYDADERRRESDELELGAEWVDTASHRHELNYVIATGELYLMATPDAEIAEDAFGDMTVDENEPIDELTVEVIAMVPSVDELHQAIGGWEAEMLKPGSIDWLRRRVTGYPVVSSPGGPR